MTTAPNTDTFSRYYRVLGMCLMPLTIGHVILLRELNCPFLDDKKDAALQDLSLAAFVCCQDFRAARRGLESRFARFFFWFWGWRARKCNLQEQFKNFRDYLDDNFWMPEEKPMTGAGTWRTLKTPFEWQLLVVLMRELHFSREAALSTTVIEASYLKVVLKDIDGTINLADDEDIAIRDAFRKAQETITPEMAAKMFEGN